MHAIKDDDETQVIFVKKKCCPCISSPLMFPIPFSLFSFPDCNLGIILCFVSFPLSPSLLSARFKFANCKEYIFSFSSRQQDSCPMRRAAAHAIESDQGLKGWLAYCN